MNINMFPTKGNLIAAKNSLALARQGYDLMDKKRNILVREMMDLVDQASSVLLARAKKETKHLHTNEIFHLILRLSR